MVLEELGRSVAPVPYLTSAVLATEILLGCDTPEAAPLLRELASGSTVCVPAVPLTLAPGAPLPAPVREGGAGLLSGTVTSVADAVAADVLLVLADTGLYAVPAASARLTPQVPLDLTRPLATVTLEAAAGTRLADPGTARAAVAGALLSGAGLLASEQLGLAEWCLAETVGHVRGRHQFNRPVGSFQALKHRLARLWLDVVGARRGPGRRRRPGHGGPRRPADRRRGPGLLLGRGRPRRRGVRTAPRRHRNDLGAPRPPLSQAGQGRLPGPRHGEPPPRPGRGLRGTPRPLRAVP